MEFVNPGYLYGLFAVFIPIIIHLFNFRRYRKVYFSNVRLLKELQVKNRKKSRLRHLLVMFARILAIIALVLAFAQPYFPAPQSPIKAEESSAVSFYIDNSFSMEARAKNTLLLEEAKSLALEISENFKPSDVFQVMTNDLLGKHHQFVSAEDFRDYVQEIEISPEVHEISIILDRISEQLKETPAVNKIIYLLSDFQKSGIKLESLRADSGIQLFLLPLEPVNVDNLSVDSCWFSAPVFLPGQQLKLHIRLNNSGNSDFEKVPLSLLVNGRQRAIASASIEAGQSKLLDLSFTLEEAGMKQGHIEISDYPVTFDDKLFLTFEVKPEIPVMMISGQKTNPYIQALFAEDSAVRLNNVLLKQLDYSTIGANRLIILDHLKTISSGLADALQRFVQSGGSVLLVPPPDNPDMLSYNEFLEMLGANTFIEKDTSATRVDYINVEHPLFEDVFEEIPENIDLPSVNQHYRIARRVRANRDILLGMPNGDVFLSMTRHGKGKLYTSATPFDAEAGNFPRHALFVPVLYKIALMTGGENTLYHTIGDDRPVLINDVLLENEDVLKIRSKEADFEFIPEIGRSDYRMALYTHDQVREAGNYLVIHDEKTVHGISMNYDRRESIMEYYRRQEISGFIEDNPGLNVKLVDVADKPVQQAINDINKGTPLWKLFIILALAFLALEIALIRLWK